MPTVTALVNIRAEDQASGELGKVGGAFDRLGGIAKAGLAVGAAVATAAVGGLVAGLTSSVAAAIEAQQVQAQLNAVLESTNGIAGVTADVANDLASKFQNLTRFEDDAIIASESILLTFTGIGKDVFPLATEAMLDISQAMGQDVKSSAVQLGKALNAPAEGLAALQRIGVTFTEQQRAQVEAMVAANDVAGAQKIILAELAREFGGSAVAAGQTFAGQMDILKNKLGDFQERIGMVLLPLIQSIFSRVAPLLLSLADKVATFFEAFVSGDAAKARAALASIFGGRTAAMIAGFIRSIRNVIDIVRSFGQYMRFVAEDGDTLNDWLTHLPEPLRAIAQAFGELFSAIKSGDLTALGTSISNLFSAIFTFTDDTISGWITAASTAVLNALLGITTWLEENAATLGMTLGAALAGILKAAFTPDSDEPKEGDFDQWANNAVARIAQSLTNAFKNFDMAFSDALVAGLSEGKFTSFQDWVDNQLPAKINKSLVNINTNLAAEIEKQVRMSTDSPALQGLRADMASFFLNLFDIDPGEAAFNFLKSFTDTLGKIADALQNIPALAHLGTDLEIRIVTPLRTALDNMEKEVQARQTTLREASSELGIRIPEGVKEGLGKTNWKEEIRTQVITPTTTALTDGQITLRTTASTWAAELPAGVNEELAKTSWSDVVTTQVITPVTTALDGGQTTLREAASKWGLSITEGVTDGLQTNLTQSVLGPLVDQPLRDALDATNKWVLPAGEEIGNSIVTGVTTPLTEGTTTLRQAAEKYGMSIPDGVEDALKTVNSGTYLPMISKPIESAVSDGATTLRQMAEKYGLAVPDGVTTSLKANFTQAVLGPLIDQPMAATLASAAGWVLPESELLGQDIVTQAGKGISGHQSEITDAMQAAMDATAAIGADSGNLANPDSVLGKLAAAWETINDSAKTAWEFIRDTILVPVAELPGKILAWFTGSPEGGESVLTKLESIDLSAAGTGIIATLQTGLESAWTGIAAWFEARKADIQNFMNWLTGQQSAAQSAADSFSGYRPPTGSYGPPGGPAEGGDPSADPGSWTNSLIGGIASGKNLASSIGDVIAMMREAAAQILAMIKELIPADEKLLKVTQDQVGIFRNLAEAAQSFVDLYAMLGSLKTTALPSLSALSDLVRALTSEFLALAAAFGDQKANEAAGVFADTAARFPAPIMAVIELVAAIQDMPPIPPDIAQRVTDAVEVVRIVVAQIGSLADMALEDMAEFADHAGRAIDLLISATAFRDAIAEWADDLQDKIAPRVEVLVAVVAIVVTAFNKFAEESKAMIHPLSEAAQAFLDSVGPVFDILESANSLRNGISEWAEELQGKIAPRVAVLLAVAAIVAAEFNRIADEATGWAVPLSEAAQAFLDSLGEALGIVQAAGDLRNSLDTWAEDLIGKVVPRISVLVSILGIVAAALNTAADAATGWVQPLSEAAAAFVASFGESLGLLQAAHGLRQALEDWTDEVVGLVAPRVDVLVSVLGIIAVALNTAADAATGWVKPLSDAAAAFVAAIGPAVSALQSAYTLRQALSDWADDLTDKVAIRVDTLVAVLGLVAAALNEAADKAVGWVKPLSDAAKAFVDSLGPALGILQTTLAFRNALGDWSDEVKGKIWLRISTLVSVLGLIALAFNDAADAAAGWIKPLSRAAKAFVDSLGPALTLLQSTLAFRNGLEDWSDEVKGKIQIRVATLVAVLGIIADELNKAADRATGWVKPLSETATAFIESVGAAVGVLQSAQAFREALGDWSDEMKSKVADRVAVLVSVLGIIATELNAKAAEGALPEITDAVKAFAERVQPLISALQGAIGLLRDLADLEIPADVEGKTRDLLVNLIRVIETAIQELPTIAIIIEKGITLPDEVAQQLELWAARVGPLATVISGAISTLAGLADLEIPADVQDSTIRLLVAIQQVIDAATTTLETIVVAVRDGKELPDAVARQLELWAARISPLTSVISSAVSTVTSLTEIDIPTGLADMTQRLLTAVQQVLDAASTTLEAITLELDAEGIELPDAVARQLELWAARISPLSNVISSATSAVTGLTEIDIPQNLADMTQALLTAVQDVLDAATTTLAYILLELDSEGITLPDDVAKQLELWAARLSPLSNVISSTVGTLKSLVDVAIPTGIGDRAIGVLAAIQEVLDAARTTLEQIIILLDSEGVELPDDVAKQLALWAARLNPLASIISSAVGALTDLTKMPQLSNPRALAEQLFAKVMLVVDVARELLPLIETANDGMDEVEEKLRLWAARVQAISSIISGGISALTSLGSYTAGATRFIDAFIADLVTIVEKLTAGLASVSVSEELEKAAERISKVFMAIRDATTGMLSLIGHRRLLPAWVDRWIADVVDIVVKVSTIEIPEGVAEKVAAIAEALGPIRDIVMSTQSLVGYRSILPSWLQNFETDVRAILARLAQIDARSAGFSVGQNFAAGFLQAWNSAIFSGFIFPGSNPVAPPGIPGPASQFYFYAPLQITTNATTLPMLLEDIQRATQQQGA